MAYNFLDKNNIVRRYENSKTYTESLTKPFPEFERIARNRPFEGIDPAYPKTTDGTAASIVQKTPKRVVQQLPTGKVIGDGGNEWLYTISQFIFDNKIVPYANEDYGLFEKSHLTIESGMTFGSTCTYTPFLNHDGYFCPDLTIPYWGDVFLQKGKKSGYSCSYIFIRSWWQKADIKALIDGENELAKSKDYTPTWDVEALGRVLEAESSKDSMAMTPGEKEKGIDTSAIELVTGFQKGLGSKFYTFNPQSKEIVRTKVNKNPTGKMPIDWFYGDIDGNTPLGRGIIELIGGLQNLIDSDMQMYQYNRALMLAPPVVKYGNIGDFSFTPNAVIDASNDPSAKIVPLTIDTTAIANYPALYGLQKSQMLNLVSSPDTSISAEVGNPGFSKVPAGIKQQQANISVDDNAVRKRYESWFENWAEGAINLYFAERTGTEKLQLDKETADELRKLAEKDEFDLSMLNDQNEILIDYDSDTPILKFRVDASTSKMADDQAGLAGLELVQKFIDGSPALQQLVPPDKQLALYNAVVSLGGVENPEDLKVDLEQFKQQQAEAQAQQQAQQAQQPQAQLPAPQEAMPPEAMMQQPNPLDVQLAQQLKQLGLSDPAVSQALSMLDQGASEQQVLEHLGIGVPANG